MKINQNELETFIKACEIFGKSIKYNNLIDENDCLNAIFCRLKKYFLSITSEEDKIVEILLNLLLRKKRNFFR